MSLSERAKRISIHALVKRATRRCVSREYSRNISIHALVKRATAVDGYTKGTDDISIHALVKRATTGGLQFKDGYVISIHALVKRATIRLMSAERNSFYFNPRPRKEGDKALVNILVTLVGFQSTPS